MSKKVAVVCANGRVGKLVVKEAVERGLDVTAFVKGKNQSVAKKSVDKDLFDITKADLAGFDVVVDAFGAWKEEDLHLHSESLKHLCDLLSGTETRLIYVGGAGSLYVAPDKMLYQTPDFPAVYLPLATAQVKTYFELKERKDVKWTFVSPAADFQAVKALKKASKKPLFCLVFIEKPLFFSNSNFQFPKFSPRSRVGAKEQNQPRGIFSYGAVFLCFLPIFSLFSPQKGYQLRDRVQLLK